ncbi:MAG: class I SAM-dependent RNA methyltransferase [Clostridia bacterium]|nr:class I SAM-dependent RNA methyltransferase [Clostridia bacterium]
MEIQVGCGAGVETATKIELRELGIDAPCIHGRFIFEGNGEDIAKCNLLLRTADRVQVVLGRFAAATFDALFEGVKSIAWQEIVSRNAAIIVNARSTKSALFALSSIQSIAKKAIVVNLKKKYSSLPETGAPVRIEISLYQDEATVTLDTSGDGLHKRGYRDLVWEAPIRETLAAAIIKLSVWNPERQLIDTFCGSGTIAIEAAMIALNIAPGLYRRFAFQDLDIVDQDILPRLKEEAAARIERDKKPRIAGYDINPKAVKLAVHHASNFHLEHAVHFETRDMRTVSSRYKYGVIITNPPYGERLLEEKELRELYRDFGKLYRSLDEWSLYAITSYADFERCFGKKADGNRKIFNAGLECRLYRYLGEKPPFRQA